MSNTLRTFHKTVITVTVLSERFYDPKFNLANVEYDITFGDCSGSWEVTSREEVDAETMARLLEAQGSDPAFFGIGEGEDEKGEDQKKGITEDE